MISILPESNYAAVMAETVEPYLDSRRQEMDMPLSTGGTLHAEVYEQPDATRAVVILHGYTESAEKFREMTWYFLNEKFNVYAIDHRGHGKSVRKISDTSITHVDAFSDYLRDLEEFMSGVVLPRTKHLPRVLYAHSMGGAIGGMTLMNHPEYFARAVLTAPMIAPSSAPLPRWAGKLAADFMCTMASGKTARSSASRSARRTSRSRHPAPPAAPALTTTSASASTTRTCRIVHPLMAGYKKRLA